MIQFWLALFCLAHAELITPETNLGRAGNPAVATRFYAFENNNLGCQATGAGPRVLLTGFGLFGKTPFNISGAVIANLADSAFWPGPLPAGYLLKSGTLTAKEGGARIQNRVLNLRGRTINACLIVADVLWDFSAAVFVTEMERFQPDLVVMTGQAPLEPVLEAAALNLATGLPGFNVDGSANAHNRPVAKTILPSGQEVLPMTWNNVDLARAIAGAVQALGYVLQTAPGARPSNDYICNNVSYIALAATRGESLNLAGGELLLTPQIRSAPQIGFLHFPAQNKLSDFTVRAWSEILVKVVDRALFPAASPP